MKLEKLLLLISLISGIYGSSYATTQSTIDNINTNLYQAITALQVGSPTWVQTMPNQFPNIKPIPGTFDSYIHLNFTSLDSNANALQARIMRRTPLNYSSNIFVTFLTLENLLEASSLSNNSQLDSSMVNNAINASSLYRDFNHPNIDATNFSPQVYNKDYHWWLPQEEQVAISYEIYLISLAHLRLCQLTSNLACEQKANANFKQPNYVMQDVDDTSMNYTIGAYLVSQNNKFIDAANTWKNDNSTQKIANSIKLILADSYQANSANFDNNLTNTVSYYMLQFYPQFENTIYINTWITNFTEVQHLVQQNPTSIPIVLFMPWYNSNKVDAVVNIRFITAIARLLNNPELGPQVLSNLTQSDQIQLQKVILSLTDWFVWLIDNHFDTIHPDVISQYYPQATILVSLLAKLDNYIGSLNLPTSNTWTSVKDKLDSALQNASTTQLLNTAQTSGNLSYWDDFLGAADQNPKYHDDRLYTTALNVNTLLDIWSIKTTDNKLIWNSHTPQNVKNLVTQAINYLELNALSTDDIRDNAVFSGNAPLDDSEYFFNYNSFIDGVKYESGAEPDNRRVLGVSGIVNQSEYNDWLALNQDKVKFVSFNYAQIPYWDSYAVTDSLIMLALTKYENLIANK